MSSNHIILDALTAAWDNSLAQGAISVDEHASAYAGEPESHTFFMDEAYGAEDVVSIQQVGEADLLAKIEYWRKLVDAHL